MRKNKMMRAASALMVAVLLTTCTISGTFAKYVTEASGSDEARVAKWGVEVSAISNELFAETYAANDENTKIATTVVADEKVVAPGTTHANGGLKFVLKGEPEVATRVKIDITGKEGTGNPVEVKLPAKTGYTDYTKATGVNNDGTAVYGNFDLANDYYPVKFILKDSNGTTVAEGTLAAIETKLNEKLADDSDKTDGKPGEYVPGTELSTVLGGNGTYTLTWEWIFDGNDQADTLLGQLAAGKATAVDGASVATSFAIKITVEQID